MPPKSAVRSSFYAADGGLAVYLEMDTEWVM